MRFENINWFSASGAEFSSSCLVKNMESTSTSEIEFYLHGNKHSVKLGDLPSTTSLCDYLRNNMGLTGTKAMCREGGCGACVVAATLHHPVTGAEVTIAINSCLVSVFSCTGWKISTVEGIAAGKNYHDIQKTLQKENGTQCGYCSPGMIMNMYALQKEKKQNLTAKEIENSFGGNICRCTGYRPIVKAFRKFATAIEEEGFDIVDIEDIACAEKCLPKCLERCRIYDTPLYYESGDDLRWYKAFTIDQIMSIQKKYPRSTVRIVAGNTAQGVYRDMAEGDVCIDVNAVAELKSHSMNTNDLVLGGNVTLTEAMTIFSNAAKNSANFKYLEKFVVHIDLVAHVPVRNIGTIAGNLMIKHKHPEFPSDIFLLLESVGSTLTIIDTNKHARVISMTKFLDYDMNRMIIKSVTLPALDNTYVYESYKIMCRAQNTHALLNAGFLLKMDKQIVRKATVVYGGVNPNFVHAVKTEKYLLNKNLFNNATLKGVFETLTSEVNPDHVLPDPHPTFRKKLANALFYKFILSISPSVPPRYKSGGKLLERDLSDSNQAYVEHPEMFPIGKSINKIEGLDQTTGEAEYIMDIPDFPGQLYGAFVCIKYPAGSTIINVNANEAKNLKGVVDFVTAADIVGSNNYLPPIYGIPDPLFCAHTVAYFNQPIGLILAKSREVAEKAAELVVIDAKIPASNPIIHVKDAVNDASRVKEGKHLTPERTGTDVKFTVTGELNIPEQYHYHMETQCCIVVPKENGEYDMYPSTQWIDLSQAAASFCMNVPMHKINVKVRRLGGAYGGKVSRNCLISCAAMVAAVKLRKPIKIWVPLESNMAIIGKRNPVYGKYTAKVDADGVFQSLEAIFNTGVGHNHSPTEYHLVLQDALMRSAYKFDTFDVLYNYVKTDIPANTYTRAPGSVEGHAFLETIMEHIAYVTGKDPLEVRMNNLNIKDHPLLKKFMDDTLTWAKVAERKAEIETFNKDNRWRKKGISVVPIAYNVRFLGTFVTIVSIYADGTVALSHGGIEMGQGINTKAVQVVAKMFGIDVEMVSAKPSNSLVSPNAFVTGASITSECVCKALQTCCQNLLAAMEYTVSGRNIEGWTEAVQAALGKGVKLTDSSSWKPGPNEEDFYYVYGVCVTEVEFDVLTGNHITRRVDLLEDTGHSLSPFIDIGQVEGAFVMSLGYWSMEELIYDIKGELMNNRTWTYKPPGMKDIPEKFYVKFPDNPNELSPFKSKATAEPPCLLGFSLPLALRQAIKSARKDAGVPDADLWVPINGPSTVEQNFMNASNNIAQYTL